METRGRPVDPNSQSARTRMYKAENPNATPKEIAAVLGIGVKTVYSALASKKPKKPKKAKKKAAPANATITITKPDLVNHPPHYTSGGIETIDFIEAKKLNYNLGNVVKYITRANLKGSRTQDLEKALWYLRREITKPTV